MRKSVLLSALLASMFLFASNSLAAPPDLASADWSVKAPHNLAANPPSDDVIKTFMANLNDGDAYPTGICDAHFADLHHSDTLSLVVAENDGRFCHPFVVDKTAGGFRKYSLDNGVLTGVPEIEDLGGNGQLEVIVETEVTEYQGAQYCMASWPVIYAWTGDGYSDVSSQYKGYYEQRLVSQQKDIAAAEAQKERAEQASAIQGRESAESADSEAPAGQQPGGMDYSRAIPPVTVENGPNGTVQFFRLASPPSPQPPATPPPDNLGLNCTKAEAAKIERFLGISHEAGMSDAIKWKNSENADDRSFAAWVLADIGTPEAMEDLQTLSHDPNSDVASSAKYALQQVGQGSVVYKVRGQFIAESAVSPGK